MKRLNRLAILLVLVTVMFPCFSGAQEQEQEQDSTALAKQTQNPVSRLVSVPFQFNFSSGGGIEDDTIFNLNFQPVIPIKLNSRWNLIARTIVPYNSYPGPDGMRFSGVGDMQEQLFLTPAKPSSTIWGFGPSFSLPTATAKPAQTGTWAMGPSFVALKMTGPWVVGALATQYWPLTDANGSPETNLFILQWFVNYNFGKGWAISAAPLNSANWDAPSGQRWTVPLGMGITRTFVFNRQPMSLGVQYYRNVTRPNGAPGNQLRFQFALLFPLKKGK